MKNKLKKLKELRKEDEFMMIIFKENKEIPLLNNNKINNITLIQNDYVKTRKFEYIIIKDK